MTWLTWLLLALVVAVIAGVTGIKPRGTRPVEHTRLMKVARLVLLMAAAIVAYLVFRSRAGV